METLREQYHSGEIFNVGDIVESKERLQEVVFRGSNYIITLDDDHALNRKWLEECSVTDKELDVWQSDTIDDIVMECFKTSLQTEASRIGIANALIELEKNGITEEFLDYIVEQNLVEVHTYLDELSDTVKDKIRAKVTNMKSIAKDGKFYSPKTMNNYAKKQYKSTVKKLEESDDFDFDFDSIGDADIDHIIKTHLSDDDYWDVYEDDELSIVDDETGEAIEEEFQLITEVLSRVERIKARIRFARTQGKRERKLKIALNRKSSQTVLAGRARKLAVKAIKARLARKDLSKLSVPEKERIEKRIGKMGKVISRITVRLMPKVKQLEKERLQHNKFTKD